jgi:hypothetical protein
MLVCNLDMLFTFVVVGWPGTAHDTHSMCERQWASTNSIRVV